MRFAWTCPISLAFLIPVLFAGCAVRHAEARFQVLPATPSYLLRAPDRVETPFPETLGHATALGQGWVDLKPRMDLRIESAYFREGSSRRGLEGYLGTEVARYTDDAKAGLRLVAVESNVAEPPRDQLAADRLLSRIQTHYRFHRYYYQVVFKSKGNIRGSVLLGSSAGSELERLAAQLAADPDMVCGGGSPHCAVFPSTCTVSLEMEIVVNGAPRSVLWGSFLSNVASGHDNVEVLRLYNGRLAPIDMDIRDQNALRLPLLPGDHINLR